MTKNVSSSNLYNLANQPQPSSTSSQQQQQQQLSGSSGSLAASDSVGSVTSNGGIGSVSVTGVPATSATSASASSSSGGNNNVTGEKDTIIANDIETDKLLNAIEKSKGFSDSFSTQAQRRLRNRAIPFQSLPYSSSSQQQQQQQSQQQQPVFNTAYNDRFQPKSINPAASGQLDDNSMLYFLFFFLF